MTNKPLQQRGLVSLLVLLLVIVLCTGQTSGLMQSCPNAGHGSNSLAQSASSPAQTGLFSAYAFSPAFSPAAAHLLITNFALNLSKSKCELTSQLIQSSHLSDSVKLFPFLLLVFVVALALRSIGSVRTTANGFPPVSRWRYRPHLHFCVFNE